MRNIVLILSVIFCQSLSFCQGNQPLEEFNTNIQIQSDKTNYLTQEEIYIQIIVTNNCDFGPLIDGEFCDRLEIHNSDGVKFSSSSLDEILNPSRLTMGENHSINIDIILRYGSYNIEAYDPILPPGDYTIRFVYNEQGYQPIESNELLLSIVDPEGEEKEALMLFRNGHKYYTKKHKKSFLAFEKLYTEYPNSVYAPKAVYYNLIQSSFFNPKPENVEKLKKKMLEDYPESHHINYGIRQVKKYYKFNDDNNGARIYLEKLKEKTNSQKLKNEIEKALSDDQWLE